MRTTRGLRPLVLVSGAVLGALVAAAVVVTARGLDVVVVRGRSMAPTLLPGDRLVAARLTRPPRCGEIVLASDPREPGRELVKRVSAVMNGRVALRGDAPAASTDGRTFGDLPAGSVRWRVIARCWPPGRLRTF